ncbi:MAG: hydrogenase expression/formation protein HypE, partial [Candidatus Bathyarchaeia archaeon]
MGNGYVTMLHGAGGSVMHEFIKNYILKFFGDLGDSEVPLKALDDAAVVDNIVLKSDSHVVKPIFFPGGDIGRLAVSGTVNDIAVMGAMPIALTCGLLLEEGFSLADLEHVLGSIRKTCLEASVAIATGDTKVVEKGSLGGCIINTSGIGIRTEALERNINSVKKYRADFNSRWLLDSNLNGGDKIILSGTIGDHGLAVLSAQEGLSFSGEIKSDVKPLNHLIQRLLDEVGGVVAMKDPTRGGLADVLNEFSEKSKRGILIYEDKIPVKEPVKVACDMLGLDLLEIGNEGKVVIGVLKEKAAEALSFLRETDEGEEAEIIGEVTDDFKWVAIQTTIGGKRVIPRPLGDPVP